MSAQIFYHEDVKNNIENHSLYIESRNNLCSAQT